MAVAEEHQRRSPGKGRQTLGHARVEHPAGGLDRLALALLERRSQGLELRAVDRREERGHAVVEGEPADRCDLGHADLVVQAVLPARACPAPSGAGGTVPEGPVQVECEGVEHGRG